MNQELQQRIAALTQQNDVVLFMKGDADFPMCGFSGRAVQILKACALDMARLMAAAMASTPTIMA